jgi:hypothetical protein
VPNQPASMHQSMPTAQELFERLSVVTLEMRETCAGMESTVAQLTGSDRVGPDILALQNLDRMTQNLTEISKLLQKLAAAEQGVERTVISDAIQAIILPSLKTYLENGLKQADQGDVELF